MIPTVTLLYGGLSALLLVLLGSWVSLRRLAIGPLARIGHPTPDNLAYAVRAHGNAAEWIPLGVVLLLLLEMSKAPAAPLHVCGGSLLAMRLMHAAYALNKGRPFPLAVGLATAHYCLLGGMALWAVWLHFH